jgi:hypothetical protein
MDLHEAQLQGADLQGALLQGACLIDAHLQGTILAGAQLQEAQLQGAELTDADLRDADLQDARYDLRTRWPAGFDPRQHGARLSEEGPAAVSEENGHRPSPAGHRRPARSRDSGLDAVRQEAPPVSADAE